MFDDLVNVTVQAAADAAIGKAAKRHRWVRIIQAIMGLLLLVLIAVVVFITFTK
jgi:hypothetical protein